MARNIPGAGAGAAPGPDADIDALNAAKAAAALLIEAVDLLDNAVALQEAKDELVRTRALIADRVRAAPATAQWDTGEVDQIAAQIARLEALVALVHATNAANGLIEAGADLNAAAIHGVRANQLRLLEEAIAAIGNIVPVADVADIPPAIATAAEARKTILEATLTLAEAINDTDAQLDNPDVVEPADATLAAVVDVDTAIDAIIDLDTERFAAETVEVVNFTAVDARIARLVGAVTAKSIETIFEGVVAPAGDPADARLANPAGPAEITAAQEAMVKLGEARKAAKEHNPGADVAVLDQRLNQLVGALVASTLVALEELHADPNDATKIQPATDALKRLTDARIAAKKANPAANVEALDERVGHLVTALVASTQVAFGELRDHPDVEANVQPALDALKRLTEARIAAKKANADADVVALDARVGELVTALVASTQVALEELQRNPNDPDKIQPALDALKQLVEARVAAKKANADADVVALDARVNALVTALVASTDEALDNISILPGTDEIIAAKDAIKQLREIKAAVWAVPADVVALNARIDGLLADIISGIEANFDGDLAEQNLTATAIGDLNNIKTERDALTVAIKAAEFAGRNVTEAQKVLGQLSAAITKTEIAADLTGATKGYGIHTAEKALKEWKNANDELQIAVNQLQAEMLKSSRDEAKIKECHKEAKDKAEVADKAKQEAKRKVRDMKLITGNDSNDKKLKGLQKVLQYEAFIEDKRYLAMDIMYDINIATEKLKSILAEIDKQEGIINTLPKGTPEEIRKKTKAQQELARLGQAAWIEAQKIEALEVQRVALQKEVEDRGVEVKNKIKSLGAPVFDKARQTAMIDVHTKSVIDLVADVTDSTAQVNAWNTKLGREPALVNIRLQAEKTEDFAERNVRAQFKAARLLDFTPESILINGNLRASYVEMLAVLAPGEAPGESAEEIQRHLSIIFKQPRRAVADGKFVTGMLAWFPEGKGNKGPLKLKALDGAAEACAVAVCRLAQEPADFVVVGTTDKRGVPEFYVIDETSGLDLSEDLILVDARDVWPPASPKPNTIYVQQNVDGTLNCAFGTPLIMQNNIKSKIPKGLTQAQLNEEPLCSNFRRAMLGGYSLRAESLLAYVKRELELLEGKTDPDKEAILARIEAKITEANNDPRYGTSSIAKAINKEIAAANIPHAPGEIGEPLWGLMGTTRDQSEQAKGKVKDLTGANDCSVATQLDFDVMRNIVAAVMNQNATNVTIKANAQTLLRQAQTDMIDPETAAKADDLDISGKYQGVDPKVQYNVTEDKDENGITKEIKFERLSETGKPLTDDETCTMVMRTGKDGGTEFELSANTMADVESMIKDAADIMSKAPGGKDQVPIISIGKYKKNFGDNFGHDKSLALRQATYIKTWMDSFRDGHVPVLQTRLKSEGIPVAMWDTYRDLKRGAEKDTDNAIKEECKELYLDRILADPKQKAEFIDGMFAQTVTQPDQQDHIVHNGKPYSREELNDGEMKDGSPISDSTYKAIFMAQANKPQGLKANRDSDIKEIEDALGHGGGRMRIK